MPRRGQDLFAAIVEAVKELKTLNFTQIARRVGASAPCVYYYLTKLFPRVGIRVMVVPNLRKLGLKEHLALMSFASEAAVPALRFLGSYCYLSYFARRLPQGDFVTLWSVPAGAEGELLELFNEMKERGLLRRFEVTELLWRKTLSLRPEFYDVREGRWRVDWARVGSPPAGLDIPPDEERVADFDAVDLRILKELQKNALAKRAEVARAIGVSGKTAQLHWLHVEAHKLIEDVAIGVFFRAVGQYLYVTVLCSTGGGVEEAVAKVAAIPFVWRVWLTVDKSTLVANLTVPPEHYYQLLRYLASLGRVEIWHRDPEVSEAFTITPELYSREGWVMNVRETVAFLAEYLKKLR